MSLRVRKIDVEIPEAAPEAALAPTMSPIVFSGLTGWLHLPSQHSAWGDQASSSPIGVVIASPLGRDARCAHRPMMNLAEAIAAAGYPVVRYDHADTGDSCDLEPESDAYPIWLEGVREACALLRSRARVSGVVLCGLRVGAALAVAAGVPADGAILLEPVLSGRSFLRKLQFAAKAGVKATNPEAGPAGLDTDGLVLSAATVASFSELDLLKRPAPGQRVFIAMKGTKETPYTAHLEASGVSVRRAPFPGYDALFLDAHSNLPPVDVFTAAVDWLKEEFPKDDRSAAGHAARVQSMPGSERLDVGSAWETPVVFGAGLRGVLTAPKGPTRPQRAVLFLNTGGDPRAGIGRFSTSASRALAHQRFASLRFDFAGLGDSAPAPGVGRSHVFETPREADLDAAINLLHSEGFREIYVVGVCAGAYHALRAVIRDPRLAGAFVVSPAKLVWRENDSLDPAVVDEGRATQVYLTRLSDAGTWRRLLRGRVDVARVARNLMSRAAIRLRVLVGDPDIKALRDGARFLSNRGGRAMMMLGLEDTSLDEVEACFGPKGERFAALPGLAVLVEPDLDHGLARSASRSKALAALTDWLNVDGHHAKGA